MGPDRFRRAWVFAFLAVVAVYLASSVRLVSTGEMAVRRGRFAAHEPRTLQAGWHLVPRGFFSVARFPRDTVVIPFGAPEPLKLVTREGSGIVAAGEVGYRIIPDAVASLPAPSREDLDDWLRARLREALGTVIGDPAFKAPAGGAESRVTEAVQTALAESAGRAGIEVRVLRFDQFGLEGQASPAAGIPPPRSRRNVLWIGVDSFDWDIIQPLMDAGRMPNMARLRREGAWGNLQSVAPLLSPVIWTSIATGKSPEKHGIVDFVATDPGTGAVIPVTSTLRRTRAFWNILGDAGVSVGVIAWWATFPAERVNGFMATDRIAYQLFKGRIKDVVSDDPLRTYPPDLYRSIAPLIAPPDSVGADEVSRFLDIGRYGSRFSEDDVSRVEEFRTLLAATRTYNDIGMELFSSRPTDVRVIYFEGPDTASHLFMPFMRPRSPNVAAEKVEWFSEVVPEFYAYQDELIGRLLDAYADRDTTVIICSDHGFKVGDSRPETESRITRGKAGDWHEPDGMLLVSGPDIRPGARILGATVLDIVPTLLALYGLPVGEDMDGKVLASALTDEFLSRVPVTTIATYDRDDRPGTSQIAGITEDDRELLAKLESLGYIQQDKPTAHINQGAISMQAGDYAKAIASYREALKTMDENAVRMSLARAYRLNGQAAEALAELETLERRGFDKAVILTERATLRREQRDWAGAERMLREALAAAPTSADVHMHLARLYEQQGRTADAVASYRQAVALDPTLAEALNQLGVNLVKIGKADEAVQALEKAIEVKPDLPGPYNNLGLLYRDLGKLDRARQVLETGTMMAPRSAVIHNSLGSLYYDMGRTDEAVAEFDKAVEADPNYAEAVSNLAVIHAGRRDADGAARQFRRLVELEPANEEARLSLAMALIAGGKPGEAVAALADLLSADPDNTKALIMTGQIHLRQGDAAKAVAFLERASRRAGDMPRLWNDLASCYLAVSRSGDAREAMRRSLRLDPNQPEISRKLAEMGG